MMVKLYLKLLLRCSNNRYMKILWTDKSASEATKGHVFSSWEAGRVVIDSRQVREGDLFVAIRGEHQDGHAYVLQALAKGAVAAVVSYIPQGVADKSRLLIVRDTMKALEDLAIYARNRSLARIVGVTGSIGKTSTKDALALVLSAQGKTHITVGNLNNHFGVPLTLANLPRHAKYAVVEMGMNHAGEIRALTKMVRPHVAMITSIQPAHLEFFASVEAISDAKMEIAEGLEPNGTLILPADSPYIGRMRTRAAQLEIHKVRSFGESVNAEYRMQMYRLHRGHSEVSALVKHKPYIYQLKAIGYHWASLTLGVIAVADALSCDLVKVAQAIKYFQEPEGRGRIHKLPSPRGGMLRIIDDSYNASPVAMQAALLKLRDVYDMNQERGRMIAVLGDMLELGADAAAQHVQLVDVLLAYGMHQVFLTGSLMRHLYEALPEEMEKFWAPDALSLLPMLKSRLREDDCVLIKGSHGSHVYQLAGALLTSKQEVISDAL
jgi:UDP-N-acetylmuramoyl-tripeptide--D-alanyl-D-alanine ligase